MVYVLKTLWQSLVLLFSLLRLPKPNHILVQVFYPNYLIEADMITIELTCPRLWTIGPLDASIIITYIMVMTDLTYL